MRVSKYMKSQSEPDHGVGNPLIDWANGFAATGQRPHRMPHAGVGTEQ